jgi:predicted aspartyl protease
MNGLALPLGFPFRRSRSAGEVLLRANRLAEAETALLEEARNRRGAHRALLAAGHLALMRNDLPLAEERLKEVVARDRKSADALRLLAEIAYRRSDWPGAAAYQEAAGSKAVAAKLRSFAGGGLYEIEGPAVARVPFVRPDPLPILRASVNGGPEADFLLDTGGAEVILDSAFASSVGVVATGKDRSYFAGGKAADLAHGGVGSFELGGVCVRNLPVQVLDLGAIGPAVGVERLAGIVGTCLLYRFRATIDYPGEALVLRRRGAEVALQTGGVEIPFMMADDHFVLAEGRLNEGAPMLFFVDSGLAGGAFACPVSTLRDAGIERGANPMVQGSGGGGKVAAWPFDISSLSLGPARQEDLQGIAGVFPPQLEWAFGFRIGGLISHGFLRAYAVTLDFERMTMRLGLP